MRTRAFVPMLLLAAAGSAAEPPDTLPLQAPAARESGPAAEAIVELLPDITKQVNTHYAGLEELYRHFHTHPELSLNEKETAARLARELRAAGCEVTEGVGGHGVVGVMKNGEGPTVMVRADMDALPIIEQTGLPYASKVLARDARGRTVGVMHACGHDINMTCLVAAARVLGEMKPHWSGTLVFVGQPAEEIGAGALAMISDGLFHRFPRPDFCLATHCDARYPHGHVNYRSGQMQANVDSVDVTVLGKGGHGAAPHTAVDPIVLAAQIVLDLQTIVSREVDPLSPAVVTVGSFHGGTKHNIIPAQVDLQLTVRTTTDEVRAQVLNAIRRKVQAAAQSAGAPEPQVTVHKNFTPALFNDPELTAKTVKLFQRLLGEENVHERPMSLGGEDFSRYIREGVPGFYYFLGSAPPSRVAEEKAGGKPLARTHTDQYYPIPEPTIKTGAVTMTAAVLNIVGK